MAENTDIYIHDRNLSGNSIWFSGDAVEIYGNVTYEIVRLDTEETLFFSHIYVLQNNPQRVDISELFSALLPRAGVIECKVVIISATNEDGSPIEKAFTVFGGGISKLMQRKLAAAGTDIFSWKLKNSAVNFFLTTRTNGRLITIPEDELLPLAYYGKGLKFSIKVDGEEIAAYDHSTDNNDSIQTIDFNVLRKAVVATKNKLTSAFDIMSENGGYACTVMISSVESKNDYFLKFLNSWGVYEKISITGLIGFSPEFEDSETVMEFDSIISDFVESKQRKKFRPSYSAEIGYKTASERLFLVDAVSSSECYLLVGRDEYAVLVSLDTSVLQDTGIEPKAISITIKLLDVEPFFSPLYSLNDTLLATSNNELILTNSFKTLV